RQRVGAGERQLLGRGVVARRDRGAGDVRRQHVAVGGERAAGERHGGADEAEVVRIRHRGRRRQRHAGSVLGERLVGRAGERRRVVDPDQRQRGGGDIIIAGRIAERAVVDLPRDGAGGVGTVVGRIVAGRVVLNLAEHRRVVRQRIVAGQRQRLGRAVVAY